MSDPRETPTERRAKEITEALDVGNWKRGLQLCEKYQKKGDTSDLLKILKAKCLLNQPPPLNERGIRETLELCDRNPPITEFTELTLLEKCLERAGRTDRSGALWDKAIRAKPQDRDFQEQRFWDTVARFDWLDAQKAANGLQKNFPGERRYYFWTVMMSLFVYKDEWRYGDDVRQLHGRLAQGYLKRAATLVQPPGSDVPTPSRAIQSGDEFMLLEHTYETLKQESDLVQLILREKPYLPYMPDGEEHDENNNNDGLTTILSLCSLAKDWHTTEVCLRRMVQSSEDNKFVANRKLDDMRIWDALVEATIGLNNDEVLKATEDKIEAFRELKPASDNAQTARLKILDHRRKLRGSDDVRDELDDACEDQFRTNCRKVICLERLKPFVHSLPPVRQDYFLHSAAMYAKSLPTEDLGVDPKTNVLKFRYCFQISGLQGEESVQMLEDFACECIKKYRLSENIPDSTIKRENDVGILAAMVLVKLSEIGMVSNGEAFGEKVHRRGPHLIQALCLLECLLSTWPNQMQAALVALRLQLLLGLGSKAVKTFKELNIKNVQHESFSHNFFTRLSTIHPKAIYESHRAPPAFDDTLPNLEAVVRFYSTSRRACITAIQKGLTEGSYHNVVHTVADLTTLENSACRRMYAYEFRRGLRLFGSGGFDKFAPGINAPPADTRTFEAFPNFEHPEQPSFETHLRLGPMPNNHWLVAEATYDKIFSLLSGSWPGNPLVADVLKETFSQIREDFEEDVRHEMSPAEARNCLVRIGVGEAAATLALPDFGTAESFQVAIRDIGEWLQAAAKDFGSGHRIRTDAGRLNGRLFCPDWTFLHWCFVTLETLQMIALFIKNFPTLKKGGAGFRKQIKAPDPGWKTTVMDIADNIRSNARQLKDSIAEPGVLGELIDVVLERGEDGEVSAVGKEIEQLMDEARLEAFCGGLRDSWDEALDGILAVKVKVA